MATYKLIQDIEAEDHIIGPLTLRQFVFALIAVFLFYINFILVTKHVAFLVILFLPPALFFAFFAIPFGRDQSTEIWALAKLRYYFKPRRRVWNQSGIKELVTITVPKKVERVLTNGLSQTEVESRLKALANTIDTRGWAVKNVNVNAFAMPSYAITTTDSDRLLDMSALPQEVPFSSVTAADDILDEQASPIGQQFDSMMDRYNQQHRQEIMRKMENTTPGQNYQAPAPQADYWFMNGSQAGGAATSTMMPQAAVIDRQTEAELVNEIKAKQAAHPAPTSHLRTLKPTASRQPAAPAPAVPAVPQPQAQAVTPAPDPAILSLANNDDLNVATIAHEANRKDDKQSPNEVSISLR